MLFNSIEFLLFFIVVLSLYLLLNHRWQNRLLLLASYFFYGFWDWRFLFLIFTSTVVDYFCALQIDYAQDKKIKKRYLFLSILVNLSILGFFKYYNFFSSNLIALFSDFGLTLDVNTINIILPIGISFYTFQSLSYTIDVYRDEMKPTRNFFDFALFISFFPQLVAGPIERAKRLLPQITKPRTLSMGQFNEGFFLMFWGLFEKIFISGNLAKIVEPVFSSNTHQSGSMVLVALYAFSFQIFVDFDGYSNIARGIGKCLGFNIMVNFNNPYAANNPQEFWRRWHISLTSWLRDYLYIPLGGNRGSNWFTIRNIMIVMILGGLWHGASWTFIIWGIYHGFILIMHRIWKQTKKKSGSVSIFFDKLPILKWFIFIHMIVVGWAFFRADSIGQASEMLASIIYHFDCDVVTIETFFTLIAIILPLLIVQCGQIKTKNLMFLYRQHWFIKTFAYALMTYLIFGLGVLTAEEFMYFQF